MVLRRKYRIVSLIVVAVLLLAGMYPDRVTQENFILRGGRQNTIICSELLQTDINNVAACMTGQLSVCSWLEQQSVRPDSQLELLRPEDFFLAAGKTYGYLEIVWSLWQASDGQVMDYMHRSDGKKRNEHYYLHNIIMLERRDLYASSGLCSNYFYCNVCSDSD